MIYITAPSFLYFYNASMINYRWHEICQIPDGKSVDERIKWHVVHRAICDCGATPTGVKQAMKKRKLSC